MNVIVLLTQGATTRWARQGGPGESGATEERKTPVTWSENGHSRKGERGGTEDDELLPTEALVAEVESLPDGRTIRYFSRDAAGAPGEDG